jgi:hypothetical protein
LLGFTTRRSATHILSLASLGFTRLSILVYLHLLRVREATGFVSVSVEAFTAERRAERTAASADRKEVPGVENQRSCVAGHGLR